MNPIRITKSNAAAIEAALKDVNGRAEAHVYSTYGEIEALAKEAEARLESLGLPKATHRSGSRWIETSGGAVANSYAKKGLSRTATRVTLSRRPTGWFLWSAEVAMIGASGGGKGALILTIEQDAEAVRRLRASYSVAA